MSVLSNVATRDRGLVQGGYGYVGVCLDSVAIVQAAVLGGGQTTIFPLLLTGQARSDLLNVARTMERRLRAGSPWRPALTAVVQAILNLDTDVDIPPKHASGACQRLLHTLPVESVFRQTHVARRQVEALMAMMQERYSEHLSGQNFPRTNAGTAAPT